MDRIEESSFSTTFSSFRDKKIVLYGIGQLTAKVLSNEKDFNFVGLMDKDASKTGEYVYGLPILDLASAEELGDLVIINATEKYWNTIYKRISNCKIPVYFKNGVLASAFRQSNKYLASYWKKSEEGLLNVLRKYEVVSFDMFDTLVSRTVLRPGDIFELIDKKCDMPFAQIRNKAVGDMSDSNYSLDGLYHSIEIEMGIDQGEIEKLKNLEIQTEKEYIVCRDTIMDICKLLIREKKEVYVISDMYFSSYILQDILNEVGLKIHRDHIIVSNEHNASKRNGELWRYYSKHYVENKKAIHVGDDWMGDVENPKKYGIDSYYIMGVVDMLRNSELAYLLDDVYTLEDSCRVGKFAAMEFQNPFAFYYLKNNILQSKDKEI